MKINNYYLIMVLLLTTLTINSPTYAVSVVDQSSSFNSSQVGFIGGSNDIDRSQVFTVGIAGRLTQIDVEFQQLISGDNSADLFMGIYATNAGVPMETAIASGSFAGSSIQQGWVSFDVSSFGIQALVGDELAFGLGVVGQPNNLPLWSVRAGNYTENSYFRSVPLGNNTWTESTSVIASRLSFKTYIDSSLTTVPVPATVWLFGSGLIGLIGAARRKPDAYAKSVG